MPASKTTSTKGVDAKAQAGERCVECWGRHPQHKTYCSWSVGSRASGVNIVEPTYQNAKDTKAWVNGGYARVVSQWSSSPL